MPLTWQTKNKGKLRANCIENCAVLIGSNTTVPALETAPWHVDSPATSKAMVDESRL